MYQEVAAESESSGKIGKLRSGPAEVIASSGPGYSVALEAL
jgi:hypothetical protein